MPTVKEVSCRYKQKELSLSSSVSFSSAEILSIYQLIVLVLQPTLQF